MPNEIINEEEKKDSLLETDTVNDNDQIDHKNISRPKSNNNLIGKEIYKAINNNLWIKIRYKNQDNNETSFMVGIKDIVYTKMYFKVDSFNISYSSDVSNRTIYFMRILSAEAVEGTYYATPKNLLYKIAQNPEYYEFLLSEVNDDNILNYYTECFKLDNVPYKTEYGLLRQIDNNVLMENDVYQLSEEQFKELGKALFHKKENKKKKLNQGYNEERL